MISPPPIIQVSLPFPVRRRLLDLFAQDLKPEDILAGRRRRHVHLVVATSFGPRFTVLYTLIIFDRQEKRLGDVRGFIDQVAFQLDPLSIVMLMVVTWVGFLIHVYSIGYMHDDEGYARYFAYLNFFLSEMLVLILGSSYLLMFVGWEGVGLCSYLLIGFYYKTDYAPAAGKKAFIVNRVGDFGFLIAMFLMFAYFGSVDFANPER